MARQTVQFEFTEADGSVVTYSISDVQATVGSGNAYTGSPTGLQSAVTAAVIAGGKRKVIGTATKFAPAAGAKPNAPVSVLATAQGLVITVSFVSDTNGAQITGYEVEIPGVAPVIVTTSPAVITVPASGSYTPRVRAVGVGNYSDWTSGPVVSAAEVVVGTPPGAPQSVELFLPPLGKQIIVVPPSNVGSGLSNYEWQMVGPVTVSGQTSDSNPFFSTTITQAGTYTPMVRSVGVGGRSGWVSGTAAPFANKTSVANFTGQVIGGGSLTVTPSNIDGPIDPYVVKFQLITSDASNGTGNRTEYTPTTSTTIPIPVGEVGRYLQISEQIYLGSTLLSGFGVTNNGGSASPVVVAAAAAPANTVAPAITGGTTVGTTITTTSGTWTGGATSYTYQFYRDGVAVGTPSTTSATSTTYTLQTADLGHTISYTVSASNGVSSAPVPSNNYVVPSGSSSVFPGSRVTSYTASGQIVATSGQTISGRSFNTPGQSSIIINSGVTGVVIEDCLFSASGGTAAIENYSAGNVTIRYNDFNGNHRLGIRSRFAGSGLLITKNDMRGVYNDGVTDGRGQASAIAIEYSDGGTISENWIFASGFTADVISGYSSNNTRIVGNTIDVNISWMNAAGFTIGDYDAEDTNAQLRNAGSNNYVAGNYVRNQVGGVPAGVFGSVANTVLEYNCLTKGIQAYNYSGTFNGVTVRNNVIGPGSFVPLEAIPLIAEWNTNILDTTTVGSVPSPGLGYYVGATFVSTLIPTGTPAQ